MLDDDDRLRAVTRNALVRSQDKKSLVLVVCAGVGGCQHAASGGDDSHASAAILNPLPYSMLHIFSSLFVSLANLLICISAVRSYKTSIFDERFMLICTFPPLLSLLLSLFLSHIEDGSKAQGQCLVGCAAAVSGRCVVQTKRPETHRTELASVHVR